MGLTQGLGLGPRSFWRAWRSVDTPFKPAGVNAFLRLTKQNEIVFWGGHRPHSELVFHSRNCELIRSARDRMKDAWGVSKALPWRSLATALSYSFKGWVKVLIRVGCALLTPGNAKMRSKRSDFVQGCRLAARHYSAVAKPDSVYCSSVWCQQVSGFGLKSSLHATVEPSDNELGTT